MMITCTTCGVDKPQTSFPKNGKDKLGNTRYRKDCKECYNITRKLTKRKAVTKFINNTKHRTGEDGTYTLDDWRDAMVYFRGGCAYCGNKPKRGHKLTRDHIVPVDKDGPTTRENIAPACRSCNSGKNNHDLDEWFPTKKFYTAERMEAIKQWMHKTST